MQAVRTRFQTVQNTQNFAPQKAILETTPFVHQKSNNISHLSSAASLSVRATSLASINFRGGIGKFASVAISETHPNYQQIISRLEPLYTRVGDTRTPFERDTTRIINSIGFAKLKGKRQVNISHLNAEMCTRIDHVIQVARTAKSICKKLGLNQEAAEAMALGHDIGHTPFGHSGESTIANILKNHGIDEPFWHERNGLTFVDNIETLPDPEGKHRTLNLTYAVRDGIICHCGEVDENAVKPRKDAIDLKSVGPRPKPGELQPYTWEGCVVKISDKVSYIGRDIEDALGDGILDAKKKQELLHIASKAMGQKVKHLDSGNVVNYLVNDLCENSSPEEGLKFSEKALNFINKVKKFNTENVYIHPNKLEKEKEDSLVLNGIFNSLDRMYKGKNTVSSLRKANSKELTTSFEKWLVKYSDVKPKRDKNLANPVLFHMDDRKSYQRSIVFYLSSLTDEQARHYYRETTQTIKD